MWGGLLKDEEKTKEQVLVTFVVVINEKTELEELISKVSQIMRLMNSNTKPDPDESKVEVQ